MNEFLMRAVLQSAVFCGLSDEDEIVPEVALQQLEDLAETLRGMTLAERKELDRFAKAEAAQQRREGDTEVADFLESFADESGLLDD